MLAILTVSASRVSAVLGSRGSAVDGGVVVNCNSAGAVTTLVPLSPFDFVGVLRSS